MHIYDIFGHHQGCFFNVLGIVFIITLIYIMLLLHMEEGKISILP